MLKAAIFDMDGLLVDSEPFWRQAEQSVFAKVGIDLTETMCMQTTGLRLDDAVNYWYERMPWQGPSVEVIAAEVLDAASRLVAEQAWAMPGVHEALELCRASGFRIALASSSPGMFIDTVVDRLGIRGYFEVLCSGEHEQYGKPHPGVYLTTAGKLAVQPVECLALEDSLSGLLAAKAARMKAVVVPEAAAQNDPRFAIADCKLESLTELDQALLQNF